jgi:hypothetical protein
MYIWSRISRGKSLRKCRAIVLQSSHYS